MWKRESRYSSFAKSQRFNLAISSFPLGKSKVSLYSWATHLRVEMFVQSISLPQPGRDRSLSKNISVFLADISHERLRYAPGKSQFNLHTPPLLSIFIWRDRSSTSTILFQKLLRLVDFAGKIRTPPSIRVVHQHQRSMISSDFVFRQGSLAEIEDQGCLALVHLGLEAALVEWPAECVEAVGVAIPAESDQTGAAEESCGGNADADCNCRCHHFGAV